MRNKAQALIISLWILSILTILAVAIGHRVSMALRLSKYQSDKLKASCLAKAAVNKMIVELDNDDKDFDSPSEDWAGNEKKFKEIKLNERADELASVGYQRIRDDKPEIIYGAQDEESKIDINFADQKLLETLFEYCGEATDKITLASNIRAWRGDTGEGITEESTNYDQLGYACKKYLFSNIEELNLVKGITPLVYDKIADLITVYSPGAAPLTVNVNTASEDVLIIIARSVAQEDKGQPAFVEPVVAEIIKQRNEKEYFKNTGEIEVKDVAGGTDEDVNLFNSLLTRLTVKSSYFAVFSEGKARNITARQRAIYNRQDKKIISWHQE